MRGSGADVRGSDEDAECVVAQLARKTDPCVRKSRRSFGRSESQT